MGSKNTPRSPGYGAKWGFRWSKISSGIPSGNASQENATLPKLDR